MRATIINPNSKFCGIRGHVYEAEEGDGKPFIFDLGPDYEFDLAVDEDSFYPGYLLLNGSHSVELLAEFVQQMARRSQNWRQHLRKMVIDNYRRVVYNESIAASNTYTLTILQKGDSV